MNDLKERRSVEEKEKGEGEGEEEEEVISFGMRNDKMFEFARQEEKEEKGDERRYKRRRRRKRLQLIHWTALLVILFAIHQNQDGNDSNSNKKEKEKKIESHSNYQTDFSFFVRAIPLSIIDSSQENQQQQQQQVEEVVQDEEEEEIEEEEQITDDEHTTATEQQDETDETEEGKQNQTVQQHNQNDAQQQEEEEEETQHSHQNEDKIIDGMLTPFITCSQDDQDSTHSSCEIRPPKSTLETITIESFPTDDTCDDTAGDGDTLDPSSKTCSSPSQQQQKQVIDKHWGRDRRILEMRDQLRKAGYWNDHYDTLQTPSTIPHDQQQHQNDATNNQNENNNSDQKDKDNNNSQQEHQQSKNNNDSFDESVHPFDRDQRPPIFLLPGLASTRLVAWKYKQCSHIFSSDIKFQDYVWLNLKFIFSMGALEVKCWEECMTLGYNQTDGRACKLRPDDGLDAIASLAPDGVGADLLVGQTNTLFAWLVQWLADNLGYDSSNLIALPYDWRLSPDIMEKRDGFLTLTRRKIEAAVQTNGGIPGILVAHSMGNSVFRYFLEWLRQQMIEEAFAKFVKQAERRAMRTSQQQPQYYTQIHDDESSSFDATANIGDIYHQPTSTPKQSSIPSEPSLFGWLFSPSPEEGTGDETVSNDDSEEGTTQQEQQEDEARELERKQQQRQLQLLWELAKVEANQQYNEWMERHIWTYVGLSAPLLGAVNPLRSVISGENMGLPFTDESARTLELSFGCTHSVNPISSKMAFCDHWETKDRSLLGRPQHDLLCLDDLVRDIEESSTDENPWNAFPQLKTLLKDRADWDSDFPMISIVEEEICLETDKPKKSKKATATGTPQAANPANNGTQDDNGMAANNNEDVTSPGEQECATTTKEQTLGPLDAQTGDIFRAFERVFNEKDKPITVKREQLENSWWKTNVPNILNRTWDRPYIKHIIMAYGVDIPTEVGYEYKKTKTVSGDEKKNSNSTQQDGQEAVSYDGIPRLSKIIREIGGGELDVETVDTPRGGGIADYIIKKKPKRSRLGKGKLIHSGDGTIPYMSLSWAHTWLLHAIRAKRYSSRQKEQEEEEDSKADATQETDERYQLDDVEVSHRPEGEMEWKPGPSRVKWDLKKIDPDTGTSHPHGTKYKPEMVKFHNVGKSRKTGMEYSTTVIEAAGVEHKETTRNYDILAAVFSEVLIHLHDDFKIV